LIGSNTHEAVQRSFLKFKKRISKEDGPGRGGAAVASLIAAEGPKPASLQFG
jgi:hypothetical protein